MSVALRLFRSSIQIANMVSRRFYYLDGNKWHGPLTRNEIKGLGLHDNTTVWWPGICPDRMKHPIYCDHAKRTLKEIKEKNKLRVVVLFFIGALLTTITVSAYPYIFDSGANKSSEEIETQINLDIQKLKIELRTVKKTNYYEIKKIPTRQVVDNYVGSYYIVNLQNADLSQRIVFPTGKYVLDDLNFDYISALNNFMNEVYIKIDKGLNVKLFVKGSADYLGHENFSDKLDPRYSFEQGFGRFEYLPSIVNQLFLFSSNPSIQNIGNTFNNSDLPNLRGRFIQYKILENFENIDMPEILEGEVKKEVDAELRNANLFMFVDWDHPTYDSIESEFTLSKLWFILLIIALVIFFITLIWKISTQIT